MVVAERALQYEAAQIDTFVSTSPLPKGVIVDKLLDQDYCSFSPPFPFKSLDKAERRLQAVTRGAFHCGTVVAVPQREVSGGEISQPMIYINDESFGMPTGHFENLDGIIVFDHDEILNYVLDKATNDTLQNDESVAYILPGGGGAYLKPHLVSRGVSSEKCVQIRASRQWGEMGDIGCDVDYRNFDASVIDKLARADRWIFVDDVICTGSTLAEIVHTLTQFYGMQPCSIRVVVEALSAPRNDEPLLKILKELDVDWEIYTGVMYGSFSQRPRLLTTRGIVKGQRDSQRFVDRHYPPELLRRFSA